MSVVRRGVGLGMVLGLVACGGMGGDGTDGATGLEVGGAGDGAGGGAGGSGAGGSGAGGEVECISVSDCDDGDACTDDACGASQCVHAAVDPDDNNACTADVCDARLGVSNTPIGRNDMDACTFDACDPAVGPIHQGEVVIFSETFADNQAGWTLGGDWQIGAAASSPPGHLGSADPAQDHTQLGDNGIAGVIIGGNVSSVVDGVMAYLTSPVFDTTVSPVGGSVELRVWRWANLDHPPFMVDTIEVYDGTQWVVIHSTLGSDAIVIDSNVPGFGDGWFPMSFDVTAYSSSAFQVRFGADVGDVGVLAMGGANYDDISVVSVPVATDDDLCTVLVCDPLQGATFTPYVPADDGIACTVEVCDGVSGIRHQPDASSCDDGDACTVDVCSVATGCGYAPVNFDDDDVCTVDSCDAVEGVANVPVDVDDGDVCTADACDAVTGVAHVLSGFRDTFATDDGWALDANWQRGPATAGCGDPASDHGPSADNMIAGVVIGGCAPVAPVDAAQFYCATSPVVDTTTIATPTLSFWRHLWSDFVPFMKNTVEVWNGSVWVVLWETLGPPEHHDGGWVQQSFDLSAYSHAGLQVRFCYSIGSVGAVSRGSWNIDDVSITPPRCGL